MKIATVSIVILIAVVATFLAVRTVRQLFIRMKTLDTAAKILVTLDKTLPSNASEPYDLTSEVKRVFSPAQLRDGKVLDGWGNPMEVTIDKRADGFPVMIRSAGPDRRMNTADDVSREELILFHSNLYPTQSPTDAPKP